MPNDTAAIREMASKDEGLARTPSGEIQFLQGLLKHTRKAAKSRRREIALAATHWESLISFRILLARTEHAVLPSRRTTRNRSGARS